ncbi:accessory factor UbiK family protein [bacterium]|uniref:Uncharacterized protein n=2 Tax=Katanobacteria TaxID=422282 RepID=A0A2M7X2I2_UNCKA|nr:accessory factor UbiK family protein [bacterium]PIP56704.1 MAG: hypothetical protein COX05_01650 [candidate division WWE3 bacterium CG22_combo_CG10-13_8_21_14_all_39_12]PJA40319.1 MAG: hypothetical protein CO179_02660 [candidate division WWE3 bacterium CG_4_9_14_3_um_filter_39_7]
MGQDPANLEQLKQVVSQNDQLTFGNATEFLKNNGMPNPEDHQEFVEHCGRVFAHIERITHSGPNQETMRAVQMEELNTLHAIAVNRENLLANTATQNQYEWDPNPHDVGFDFMSNGKIVHRPMLEEHMDMVNRLEQAQRIATAFAKNVESRGVDPTFYSIETYLLQNPNATEGIDPDRLTGLLNIEITNLLNTREDLMAIPETHRNYRFYKDLIQASIPTIRHELVEQADPEYVEKRALAIIENQEINSLSEMDLEEEFDVLSTFLIRTGNDMRLDTLNAREPALNKLGNPNLQYNSQTRELEYQGKPLSSNKTKARINLAYIMQGKEPVFE